MLELLLIIQMSQAAPILTADVRPCVWPNKCEKPVVAEIRPCVWPNKCAAPALAQFQLCVWPRRCAQPGSSFEAQNI